MSKLVVSLLVAAAGLVSGTVFGSPPAAPPRWQFDTGG